MDTANVLDVNKTVLAPLHELTFETASEHVYRRVPIVSPTSHVDEVRHSLLGASFDTATHIAVCVDGKLKGMLSIESLFAAMPDAEIAQIMDADPPQISPSIDQELAVRHAIEHKASAIAVIDHDGNFIGFIPPHRLIAILQWEHEEDMSRFSGFLRDTDVARRASVEAVVYRFMHRIPWLLLGLVGALVAADIVAQFEAQLEKTVTLAFFIPGIVYIADAVGTQTETLIVRGLSVGVHIGDVIKREIVTGVLIGLALSLIFFPLALWRWGDAQVALVVSLSIWCASSIATLIALGLPWVFHSLGKDPAYSTGPLATVIQDLLSIVIYLLIATAIIH